MRQVGIHITWTGRLSEADAAAFDRFVDVAGPTHYSQTRAWARITAKGYPLVPRYFLARDGDAVIGAAVVLRPGVAGLVAPVAWVERGPVVAEPERLPTVLAALRAAARRRGALWLHVMPYVAGDAVAGVEGVLAAAGFRNVQKPGGTHAVTLRLPIGGRSDDEMLAGADRETLRRKLRQAAREGVTVRRGGGDDVVHLERLYGDLMRFQGRKSNPGKWFRAIEDAVRTRPDHYALFLGGKDGDVVNASLFVRQGGIATFVTGASTTDKAAYAKAALPMVAGARWARDLGCSDFDLGGVPLEGDTDAKRVAIARFKHEFTKAPTFLVREHAVWLP